MAKKKTSKRSLDLKDLKGQPKKLDKVKGGRVNATSAARNQCNTTATIEECVAWRLREFPEGPFGSVTGKGRT